MQEDEIGAGADRVGGAQHLANAIGDLVVVGPGLIIEVEGSRPETLRGGRGGVDYFGVEGNIGIDGIILFGTYCSARRNEKGWCQAGIGIPFYIAVDHGAACDGRFKILEVNARGDEGAGRDIFADLGTLVADDGQRAHREGDGAIVDTIGNGVAHSCEAHHAVGYRDGRQNFVGAGNPIRCGRIVLHGGVGGSAAHDQGIVAGGEVDVGCGCSAKDIFAEDWGQVVDHRQRVDGEEYIIRGRCTHPEGTGGGPAQRGNNRSATRDILG